MARNFPAHPLNGSALGVRRLVPVIGLPNPPYHDSHRQNIGDPDGRRVR